MILVGAEARREANCNIDFLNELERQVERMDDLPDARLAEVVRDINNARREQEQSRNEIRAQMREAFAAIGVHLGNRNARAVLRDLAKAKAAAERLERNKNIIKLGNRGLSMIDNAMAANRALNAVKNAVNSAFSYFK